MVHENQSCSWHAFSFFFQAYKRAVPVYLPVYLIPALIVHRQGLGKRYVIIRFDIVVFYFYLTNLHSNLSIRF